MGRPSSYSEKVANSILDAVANGSNLSKICAAKTMPDRTTVYRWMRENDAFHHDYTRAREDRADTRAEKMDDIAERTLSGEYDPAAARVAMDSEKWQAAREAPKRYGDKLDLNHGGDGLTVNIVRHGDQ